MARFRRATGDKASYTVRVELFSQTVTFTWVVTKTIRNTEKGHSSGKWATVTKGIGSRTKNVDSVSCITPMGRGTKVSGKRDRNTGKAGSLIQMEWSVKVNGK